MSLSSLSSVKVVPVKPAVGDNINIVVPNIDQRQSGPLLVGPYEFIGFAYQRYGSTPAIDVRAELINGTDLNQYFTIRREASLTTDSIFWPACLPVNSSVRIRFRTTDAGGSEDHAVLLLFK